jgi:glycosyltransferase involved in cell wall biosynthesis
VRVLVAYDATSLLGPRTGVGIMASRVLEGLATTPDVRVRAFACTWRGRHVLTTAVPPGVDVVERPVPARPAHLAWRRTGWPPVEWITGRVDVVHGPNFVVPPARHAGRVVTVHDLTALHHPEMCTPHSRTYPAHLRRALATGAYVHTVSDFVRAEVLAAYGADPARVVTVPNGVDPIPDADPADGRRAAGGHDYVLALGTIEPRKDHPGLLRAFDALAADHPELRLVVAGPDGWGVAAFDAALAAMHHRDRVVRIGMVGDVERAALLRGARLLVFPSRYEGFGLPPLEAMGAGTPVVATRAGAVPEVCADAAELVDVGDEEALHAAMARVLTDDARRAALVRLGTERAARFTWPAQVSGLVSLYRLAAPSD